MIHEFLMFYSKNKLKKYKNGHTFIKDDDIILNQRELRDKKLMMDTYYKMR